MAQEDNKSLLSNHKRKGSKRLKKKKQDLQEGSAGKGTHCQI